MTTDKQKKYLIHLLGCNGFDMKFMHAKYKVLGVTMNHRSGKVSDWIDTLDTNEASRIIQLLLDMREGAD